MAPSRSPLLALLVGLAACTAHERTAEEPPPHTAPPPPPPAPTPAQAPPPPATPARCFAARSDIPLPHVPLGSQFDDINNDDRPDLVINFSLAARVVVLLNRGDGDLQLGPELILEHDALGIELGDFDNDFNLDLAAFDDQGSAVRVHLGRGDGTFDPKPKVTEVGKHLGVGVAERFTDDGYLDLVVPLKRSFAVLEGNVDGTFTPYSRVTTGRSAELRLVGNFNDDDNFDIITVDKDDDHLSLFLPRGGSGKFAPARDIPCVGGGHALAVHAFDPGNTLDLAVASRRSHDVCVLLGDDRGNFTAGPVLPAGFAPHALAAADITGDDITDLIVATWGAASEAGPGSSRDGAVIVFAGDGNGGFTTRAAVAVGNSPSDLYTHDLDGDSHDEAITVNTIGRSVTILRGSPCPPPSQP